MIFYGSIKIFTSLTHGKRMTFFLIAQDLNNKLILPQEASFNTTLTKCGTTPSRLWARVQRPRYSTIQIKTCKLQDDVYLHNNTGPDSLKARPSLVFSKSNNILFAILFHNHCAFCMCYYIDSCAVGNVSQTIQFIQPMEHMIYKNNKRKGDTDSTSSYIATCLYNDIVSQLLKTLNVYKLSNQPSGYLTY